MVAAKDLPGQQLDGIQHPWAGCNLKPSFQSGSALRLVTRFKNSPFCKIRLAGNVYPM